MAKKQLNKTYRPKSFDEVTGQGNAVRIVQGFIKDGSIFGRGLLFYGPHGVGKTSLARILSQHLNCENYNVTELKPCGDCDFCRAVKDGEDPAVEEMDFGNARGIDTVRSLIDSLEYVGQYKARVIILDECHHMTGSAGTALLKALEEPPENVIFVLVTTDPSKLSPALRSRCAKVPFGRIPPAALVERLQAITTAEGATLPEYAFGYIAKSSHGILRDAIGQLEVLLTIAKADPQADLSNHHTLEEKLEVDGTSPSTLANLMIGGIYTGSYGKTLPVLHQILSSPTFNHRFFADRMFEYHQQTFHCMIDPAKSQRVLFSDFYNDWYATLEQVVKKKSALQLSVTSGEIIFDLIMEMSDRLKNFEAEPAKLVTLYVMRMVRAVKENNQTAYTKQSPFHAKFAAEHCNA